MKRILAVLLVLSIIFAFSACSGKENGEETTTVENGFEVAQSTSAEATSANGEASSEAESEAISETAESTTAAAEKMPETMEEVIAKYKEVMDQAKQKDKPGFTRLDYQELLSDPENRVIGSGEGLINAALTLAGNFMKTKKEAEKKPTIGEKGGDMEALPLRGTTHGCLLNGTKGVRSAKCEKLNNGYYKITIVLEAEKNPEPTAPGTDVAPSITGSVCSPISKAEIDADLATGLFKDITYSLTYHDCETVLIYNPENNHIYSQEQTNRVTIKGAGTIGFVTLDIQKQELINHVVIKDLKY